MNSPTLVLFLTAVIGFHDVVADDFCNGNQDSLALRFSPFYGRKMEQNSDDDDSTYWILAWARITKRTQLAYSSKYEAEVRCFVPFPRRLDGQTTWLPDQGSTIYFGYKPEACFNGPSLNREGIFLLRTDYSPSTSFQLTAEWINAPFGSDDGISTWMAVTNMCPLWKVPSSSVHPASFCPNSQDWFKYYYNVPPGCFYDISASKMRTMGAALFLYQTSKNCAKLGSTSDSLDNRMQMSNWTIWGRPTAVDYATRLVVFKGQCLLKSFPRIPADDLYAYFAPEYDGCMPFDEETVKMNRTYLLVADRLNNIQAQPIETSYEHYRQMANICSANSMMPLSGTPREVCQAPNDFSVQGCYPDLSISQVKLNGLTVSPTRCLSKPCTNFTEVYEAADQIFWLTVVGIEDGCLDINLCKTLKVVTNCMMKSKQLPEVTEVLITADSDQREPISVNRDYIMAVKSVRRVSGKDFYEVISPPIQASKTNWRSLCTSCDANDLPWRQPGVSPLDFFNDLCSVDVCYRPSTPSSNGCVHQNLDSFACQGISSSLATRFEVSSIALYGIINEQPHRQSVSSYDEAVPVLYPSGVIKNMLKTERELHVNVAPLCQLTGEASDLGPGPSVQLHFDAADCFNVAEDGKQMFMELETGQRYLLFANSHSAAITALPIKQSGNDSFVKVLSLGCFINPPEFPIAAVGRVENIDYEYLSELCPFTRYQYCLPDVNISNVLSNFVQEEPTTGYTPKSTNDWSELTLIMFGSLFAILTIIAAFYVVAKKIAAIEKTANWKDHEEYITEEPRLRLDLSTERSPLIPEYDKITHYNSN